MLTLVCHLMQGILSKSKAIDKRVRRVYPRQEMGFTTTLTTKNQLTLPKSVQEKLGVRKGVKFDIYPTSEGFVGLLKRKSKILDYAGDLKALDDGRPLKEIRREAQSLAARAIADTSK